jgi:hypothetical protein
MDKYVHCVALKWTKEWRISCICSMWMTYLSMWIDIHVDRYLSMWMDIFIHVDRHLSMWMDIFIHVSHTFIFVIKSNRKIYYNTDFEVGSLSVCMVFILWTFLLLLVILGSFFLVKIYSFIMGKLVF